MKVPVVVLDSNVFVSAFLFGGPPERIWDIIIDHSMECFISAAILDEVRNVIQRPKFRLSSEQVLSIVEDLRAICQLREPIERVDAVSRDADDNKILECALAARAEVIVTGDSHLLELDPWRGIRILSPTDFLAEIEQ